MTIFFCVICLKFTRGIGFVNSREDFQCKICGSSPRDRAVALAVRKIKFFKTLRLQRVQSAIGIADLIVIENFMNTIFGDRYVNYHFHKSPKIDITRIENESVFEADLVICSDVLEHVQAPVENGFFGLNKILKDKGILVMSVPHTDVSGSHIEHFPILKDFRIIEEDKKVLIGTDYEGNLFKKDELIFHGGDGEVLEFRVFSETSLKQYLSRSNFTKIKEVKNNSFFGIGWEPWSRVWVAKAHK